MATALDASHHIVSALEMGANDYVTKPLDFSVVLARVRTQISLRRAVEKVRALEQDLERRNRELQAANEIMRNDLDAAARVQAALLPAASPDVPGYEFAWLFKPSATLAGDLLNVFRLDEHRTGMFVLDVSGHGVAASLLSVTVSRFLSPVPDPSSMLWRHVEGVGYELETPPAVASRLGQRFPFDNVTNQFLTLVYGVLDSRRHELRYVSAGHPKIISLMPDGSASALDARDYPIGVGANQFEEHAVPITPGQRLYLYSDGITEARSGGGKLFGHERLVEVLQSARDESLVDSIELVWAAVADWAGGVVPGDDQTMLAIQRDSPESDR
jgi:sigma-B regulation protein RsbU (phosphoserine phosphatase)